jgi:hypothetical protein
VPTHNVFADERESVSRNRNSTALCPVWEFAVHFACTGKSVLGASVTVAYTNDGYLRDAYRWVTGAYGSLIAVDQGAWR